MHVNQVYLKRLMDPILQLEVPIFLRLTKHQCTVPRSSEAQIQMLADRIEVKWCGLCSKQGDHYRAGHTDVDTVEGGNIAEEVSYVGDDDAIAESEGKTEEESVVKASGPFVPLSLAGLI